MNTPDSIQINYICKGVINDGRSKTSIYTIYGHL